MEPHVHEITMSLDQLHAEALKTAPELRREQKKIEQSELSLNLARKQEGHVVL